MTATKRPPVRVRRAVRLGWVAFCRRCWWYRSYPIHATAVHAADQHVLHWLKAEDEHGIQSNEVPF